MKASYNAILYLSLLSLLVPSVLGQKVRDLNLTAVLGATNGHIDQHSSTVQLSLMQFINWTYEMKSDHTIDISNVQYIDTGTQSLISVYCDNSFIARFTSVTSDSNQLVSSGRIGLNIKLPRGTHIVSLEATHTDEFGIKINTVTIRLTSDQGSKLSTSNILTIVFGITGTIATAVCALTGAVIARIKCRSKDSNPEKQPLQPGNKDTTAPPTTCSTSV